LAVAPSPSYIVVVQIAPDVAGAPGAYVSLGNATKGSFAPKQDLVDKTYLGGNGARDKLPTIRDGQIQLSGQFPGGGVATPGVVSSDTAQNTLFASLLAGDPYVWIKILWDGTTHGPSLQTILSGFKLEAAVAGAVDFSCSAEFNSAPVYA
jgi:hypothetical protein